MASKNVFRDIREILEGIESLFKENKNDPEVSCGLVMVRSLLEVSETDMTAEEFRNLNLRYQHLQEQYAAVSRDASHPGMPWLDDPRYI